MENIRSAAVLAVALMSAIAAVTAQRGAPLPVRDNARPVDMAGAASISGTIVEDNASAAPIKRATVTLRNVDAATSRITVTDDQGRYLFDELPAGHFTLSISKPAYVSTAYGARALRGQGLTIALTAGQHLT